MDEAPTIERLSYGKDELQNSGDVVQEDDLETMPDTTADTAIPDSDPFSQQDYLTDLRMESLRLTGEHLMIPKRRLLLEEENETATEEPIADVTSESENRKSNSYDEDSLSGEQAKVEISRKTHSSAQEQDLINYQAEEARNSENILQDKISFEVEKSAIEAEKESKNEFTAFDHDKFNNSFVNSNNGFTSNSSDNETDVKDVDNDYHESMITAVGSNLPGSVPLRSTVANDESDDQRFKLSAPADGSELISSKESALITGTHGHRDDNFEISPNEKSARNLPRKQDDVGKISSKLEAFSKNTEISTSPVKTPRTKIDDTEMPTKGVVSNLKSLFENNAVHNNNDTYKSANYKLEYGVGRSAGTLNKGVFQ